MKDHTRSFDYLITPSHITRATHPSNKTSTMSPSHLALLLLLLLATSTHATPVTITTTYGPVTGTSSSSSTNITTFYGIPFAAPPLGELRFKPPQPPTPWSRPVVATNPDTPMCMQDVNSGYNAPSYNPFTTASLSHSLLLFPPSSSEDCLTLDIYTPTTNPQANLSVMMWIYGGGFTSGDDYENGRVCWNLHTYHTVSSSLASSVFWPPHGSNPQCCGCGCQLSRGCAWLPRTPRAATRRCKRAATIKTHRTPRH